MIWLLLLELYKSNKMCLTECVQIKLFTTLETNENLLDSNEQIQIYRYMNYTT